MRNFFSLIYIGFVLLISCNNNTTYSVGQDLININTQIKVTDTLTVRSSTTLIDSIETSTSSRLLLGGIKDREFGNLTAQSFINIKPSDYTIDKSAVYDSIGLILYYDKYYYGDTLQTQTYKIHQINENFKPYSSYTSFYNNSSLSYNNNVLGELTFVPYPRKNDSIYIPMKETFGKILFTAIQDGSISNYEDFYNELKGITIVPEGVNSSVLGFNKSSLTMRMYYTVKDELNESTNFYKDFTINTSSTYHFFNKTVADRSDTNLKDLKNYKDILNSSQTGNLAYIQSGSPLTMRVEIPYIRNLNTLDFKGSTLSATLKFYPTYKSYKLNPIGADSLAVYIVDNKNRVISQLTDSSGNVVYGKFNSGSDEFDSKNYYTTDITAFVNEIQSNTYKLNYALLFQFPNYNSNVNEIKIYNSTNPDFKMKVSLTYLLY